MYVQNRQATKKENERVSGKVVTVTVWRGQLGKMVKDAGLDEVVGG